jgi:hypothetical protein
VRIQALDKGFQAAEQKVEVKRRRGAVHRNLPSGSEPFGRSRTIDQFEIAVAN